MSDDEKERGFLAVIAMLFGQFFDRLFDSGPSIEDVTLFSSDEIELSESEELLELKMEMLEDYMDKGLF